MNSKAQSYALVSTRGPNMITVIASILIGLTLLSTIRSQSIYAVPNAPKWPVIMTVVFPPQLNLTDPTISWTFLNDTSSSGCTIEGIPNVIPCIGKVVDHVFPVAGMQTIVANVTDPSLSAPLILTINVNIQNIEEYPVVQRPEIRKVEDARWQRYIEALFILKDTGIYDHLANVHRVSFGMGKLPGTRRGDAHSGPTFPYFHRMLIRVVERCLQHASGDDTLALPYFEWELGWIGLDKYLGGDGNPDRDYVVSDGPFCNDPFETDLTKCPKRWVLPQEYPQKYKAIRRKIGNDTTFHFETLAEYDKLMSISEYDMGTFDDQSSTQSFRSALEGWPTSEKGDVSAGYNHNGVHRYIGGTMTTIEWSMFDPSFLIHHAKVDRLLWTWRINHGCGDGNVSARCYRPQPNDPDLVMGRPGVEQVNGQTVLKGQMANDLMYPWNLKISDLASTNLGYAYLGVSQTPAKLLYATPNKPDPTLGNRTEVGVFGLLLENSGNETEKEILLSLFLASIFLIFV